MQRATVLADPGQPGNHPKFFRLFGKLLNWPKYLTAKARVNKILATSDIALNGSRPWDLIVKEERFYRRVLRSRSLGLGDSYLDGWWECANLEEFFYHLLRNRFNRRGRTSWQWLINYVLNSIFNVQTRLKSKEAIEKHYDLGNTLYQSMLDARLVYTCGRWKHAQNLDEAQEEKLHIVCESLALQPQMRLLDIGCGWGSLAKFAAEKYGVTVVGITISEQQLELARQCCAGLPIKLYLQDYRDVQGKFDRIVSLGMFEHVGVKNYRAYFNIAHRLLQPDGLFYLETIGSAGSFHQDDPWILKHIFPNSHIPSWKQVTDAIQGLFSIEKKENWGEDYRQTVKAWLANFESNWNQLRTLYDERFHRMWRYYLEVSAAAFHAKGTEVWQILLLRNSPHIKITRFLEKAEPLGLERKSF